MQEWPAMTIALFNLTFVYTETILDVQRGLPAEAPLADFVTEPGYIDNVDKVLGGSPGALGLTMPWPHPNGQHFWDAYLLEKQARDATGSLCFKRLVPLRLPKLAESFQAALPGVAQAAQPRLGLEGFYFPHGTGLLIKAAVAGSFDTAQAGHAALSLRYDKVFRTCWSASDTQADLCLDEVATAALDRLRQQGYGKGVSGRRSEMFSIATITRGDGADPLKPLAQDGPDHRLLNGLVSWIPDWEKKPLGPPVAGVSQLRVKDQTAFPGNVLFADKRGRAVWFPSQFLPPTPPRSRLGCYNRNLGAGSLQVESLLMLCDLIEEAFSQGGPVPASIQRLGRLAAGLLGPLYGVGLVSSWGPRLYRSDSLRAQIAQSRQLPGASALRQRLGMPAIP
jgi:hypothetical protein